MALVLPHQCFLSYSKRSRLPILPSSVLLIDHAIDLGNLKRGFLDKRYVSHTNMVKQGTQLFLQLLCPAKRKGHFRI